MGSFRLTTGTEHLHSHCNFAELIVETVWKSLCHSCRSELTRQGISLVLVTLLSEETVISTVLPMSPIGVGLYLVLGSKTLACSL